MIDEETSKSIQDQLASLPKTVQEAILHSNWQEKIRTMAKKYALHIDQTGELQNETFLVMLGLDDPESFSANLIANLGLSNLIATQLSMEVNEIIFKPIREELQKQQVVEENAEQNPTKESVLEGIEHPAPAIHPQTTPEPVHPSFQPLASQLAMPGPLDTGTPAAVPLPVLPPPPPVAPATTAIPKVTVMPQGGVSNIVHDRLSQMVQMAKKEMETQPVKEAPKTAPTGGVDPYREPIN